jgi:cysteine desulfurase
MLTLPIYLDNHATTRLDTRVLEAMLPYFTEKYGNAGSVTHDYGREAKDAVDAACRQIAEAVGASPNEIVFTSGATESNNLALKGVAAKRQDRGRHIVSVATEHPSVLDPLKSLARRGFEITFLPVISAPSPEAGLVRIEELVACLRDDTILVSIMLANNEIGVVQPLTEIGRICRDRGVVFHSDATQAVGKLPVDVPRLNVDLMSFSAHKIYGPKGVGALYVWRGAPRVRIEPILEGGGQEDGLRSGTLNTPGIVGFARALQLCVEELPAETERLRTLRDRLFAGLHSALDGVTLNGPVLSRPELRLPGNLNASIEHVDGEALLINARHIALSSGSACTSATPEPSHVLRALRLSDEVVRTSVRFGLGRFNTPDEIEFTIARLAEVVPRLRAMGSG